MSGAAKGAIGSVLAELTLTQLRAYELDYSLVIDGRRNSRSVIETVQHSTPDGTTLLQAQSSSIVLYPSTYKSLSYDPIRDFVPLTILGTFGYSLVLGTAVPSQVKTLEGYLSWVSQNPDMRDLGFAQHGSQAHLLCLMLAQECEIAVRPLAFSAATSLFSELANGTIGAAMVANGNIPLFAKPGIRAVAVTDAQRLRGRLDIPTFAEAGIPALNLTGWFGWFAPAKTPKDVLAVQAARLSEITESAEYDSKLTSLLVAPDMTTPDQITERLRAEIGLYAGLTKQYRLSIIE